VFLSDISVIRCVPSLNRPATEADRRCRRIFGDDSPQRQCSE